MSASPETRTVRPINPSPLKRGVAMLVLAGVVASSLGCAHGNNQQTGAFYGSMVGALIGATTGVRNANVLTGQLLGALAGSGIGYWYDTQLANRAAVVPKDSVVTLPRLSIEKGTINPDPIVAGQAVNWAVNYTAIASNPDQEISLTETREIVSSSNEKIPLKKRTVSLKQGAHESKVKLTFPKDLPPGEYTMVVTLSDGVLTQRNEVSVQVLPQKLKELGSL